jgi:hypothetical protein
MAESFKVHGVVASRCAWATTVKVMHIGRALIAALVLAHRVSGEVAGACAAPAAALAVAPRAAGWPSGGVRRTSAGGRELGAAWC